MDLPQNATARQVRTILYTCAPLQYRTDEAKDLVATILAMYSDPGSVPDEAAVQKSLTLLGGLVAGQMILLGVGMDMDDMIYSDFHTDKLLEAHSFKELLDANQQLVLPDHYKVGVGQILATQDNIARFYMRRYLWLKGAVGLQWIHLVGGHFEFDPFHLLSCLLCSITQFAYPSTLFALLFEVR